MKKNFTRLVHCALFSLLLAPGAKSQCLPGYTQAQLNWDYLDYLVTLGNYSGFVTNAIASTQHFMLGTTRTSIAAATPSFTLGGENATHTGDLAGYTGQDVQFTPTNSTDSIVITFDQVVMNASFVLYDIDNAASYRITARNEFGIALSPTLTRQVSTILTLGGTPTAPTVTSTNTGLANTSNQGSVTISVTGPVKVIKIALLARGSDAVIWLSDINACVTGSFPNDWRNISRPFTGMPPYILTVEDNNFMMLNPLNGKAKPLFTDPGWTNMNGMAYDPYHRVLYYTYSLTPSAPGNKTIWKYDIDSETIGTLVSNVTTALGIPTYDQGVESGSASFYNGYYYFGVESSNTGRSSGRENTVWRIEFDAAQNPTRATQVYATRSDSTIGGTPTLIHDWSDIGVTNNGMLYDFDGAATDPMFYHFNLMTGQRTQFTPSGSGINFPRQMAIDWAENVYNQGNVSNTPPSTGFIVPYNYNGTVNAAQNFTVMLGATAPTGSYGDCSEAYRPLCDFGDAPPSYDPDPWSPAVHERDTALRIGSKFDREWNKASSDSADADGADEDGLSFVPIFSPDAANYLAQIPVYNNTGENATVVAWLDFNGNGYFDPIEACQTLAPIASSPNPQNVYLYWPNAPTGIAAGFYTYLRVRITKATHGMGAANSTGYYEDGEVEDYKVIVDGYPLAVNLIDFTAKPINNTKVNLAWSTTEEVSLDGFEIERSTDNNNWMVIGRVNPKGNTAQQSTNYNFTDFQPGSGKIWYRLKMLNESDHLRYSETRTVELNKTNSEMKVWPNPAFSTANISLYSMNEAKGELQITDANGALISSRPIQVNRGSNQYALSSLDQYKNGMYLVQAKFDKTVTIQKLIIKNKN